MRKNKNKNYKLKPKVERAGFGAANFFVTLVFLMGSYGVLTDITKVAEDITERKSIYKSLHVTREELAMELDILKETYERLHSSAYLEIYATGSMWLTRPGENLFVIKGPR